MGVEQIGAKGHYPEQSDWVNRSAISQGSGSSKVAATTTGTDITVLVVGGMFYCSHDAGVRRELDPLYLVLRFSDHKRARKQRGKARVLSEQKAKSGMKRNGV